MVLIALTVGALAVRAVAAVAVERAARRDGALCLFDDTKIYWRLGEAIRLGRPYEVEQFGVPHQALRTPGYPLFLAACQAAFGASATLGARLVQAMLGAACVPLVFALTRRVWPDRSSSTALIAAALAAFEPYGAATAALLLSEAVFVPLMLLMLWGLATLWTPDGRVEARRARLVALATGLAAGAGVMVKPSWALALPLALAAWLVARGSLRRPALVLGMALGAALVMGPWWARNARAFGAFVPTALWAGASLYDGLNSSADGSSDMRFLASDEFNALGEVEQDRVLRDRALAFAREHPGRAARLALTKAGRFWSPWPNAREFRASWAVVGSAAVTLPIFALLAIGIGTHRRDGRALVLLGGPLVYFFALHLIFVSSIRYRISAEVPAFGLAAAGLARLRGVRSPRAVGNLTDH